MFMELHKEKREEGDRSGQEDKRGESKGESSSFFFFFTDGSAALSLCKNP